MRARWFAVLLAIGSACSTHREAPPLGRTTAPLLWTTAASMATARQRHVTVRLPSGKVLVAGGRAGTGLVSTAEIYDPATNTWSAAGTLVRPRFDAGGAPLSDGRVLIAGGDVDTSFNFTSSAEIWDPATNTWSETTPMPSIRTGPGCLALADGRVLVASGGANTAHVFDPATKTWTATGPLLTTHVRGTIVPIASGKSMLVGGTGDGGWPLSVAEIYDPSTNGWTTTGATKTPRQQHSAAPLPGGKVIVIGGAFGTALSDAEVWDPATGKWSVVSSMATARERAAAVALSTGKVLVVGGAIGSLDAEIYDPVRDAWLVAAGASTARRHPTTTLLDTGEVLVAGGEALPFGGALSLAERFVAAANGTACTTHGHCLSGFCVDGVCCDAACTSACAACDVPGSAGTCTAVTGKPHGARSCAPFGACAAGACVTACTTSAECDGSTFCLGGSCAPKKANGVACGGADQCGSGHCVDEVCCDSACTGQCAACDVPGSFGTCSPVRGQPRGGRPACTGVAVGTTCGHQCTGAGTTACGYPTATVACGDDACAEGVETRVSSCDGAGLCAPKATSCGAYACGATSCKVSCAADADCAPGHYCKGSACVAYEGLGGACTSGATCGTGHCVDGVCCASASCAAGSACASAAKSGRCAKVAGAACAVDDECGSGFCVDGVCCETACAGQCEACDVEKGKCLAVSGAPRGARAACDTGTAKCEARACDGVTRASCERFAFGAETDCSGATCSGGTFSLASQCDGKGACVAAKTTSCVPFACDAKGCLASCTDDAQCAPGFGCEGSTCVARAATCSSDGLSSLPSDPSGGTAQSCAPYRCGAKGTCETECASSERCAPGALCSGGACVLPGVAADEGSGCSVSPASRGGSGAGASWLVLAVALVTVARRRRTLALAAVAALSGCSPRTARDDEPTARVESAIGWSPASSMSLVRRAHSATVLADGRVLIAGGSVGGLRHSTAEIYDPATKTFTAAATMKHGRDGHGALRLPDGKILVAGGTYEAEIYDPVADAWSLAGSTIGSSGALVWTGGLVPGGTDAVFIGGCAGETRTFDYATRTWTLRAAMPTKRFNASAVRLASGKVLVAGGDLCGGGSASAAELWDPTTLTWSTAASMSTPRAAPMLALSGGRAMIAGGNTSTAEVYDEATDTWTTIAPMAVSRATHRLALLPNGRIFASGGDALSEVYDVAADAWFPAGTRAPVRRELSIVSLPSGAVLVSGGTASGGVTLSTAEVFALVPNGQACEVEGECTSGHCVGGLCCDTACGGTCDACDLPGELGTCSPVTGAPRHGRSCGGAVCAAGACASGCTSDAGCVSTHYCASSSCAPKKSDGAACSGPGECASGFCVDGVCCDTACTAQCAACDGLGKVGTCAGIVGAPHGARPACAGAGLGTTCGPACDGKDLAKCTFAEPTTFCSATACKDGVETHASLCDGAGACKDAPKACGAYACGATACRLSCTTTAECAPGHHCKGGTCAPIEDLGAPCGAGSSCKTGFCVDGVCCASAACDAGSTCASTAKPGQCIKAKGTACALGDECATGLCVDGVCCDRACDGQCEACDVAGSKGTCQGVVGAPHGARAPCDTASETCAQRQCDGTVDAKSCVGFARGPEASCGASSCSGSTFTHAPSCDGKGACRAPTVTECVPYRCDEAGCLASCTSDAQCAPGFECFEGECDARKARCSDGGASSTGLDGAKTSCAPYRCGTGGECLTACVASTDCAGGHLCDTAAKLCMPVSPSEAEDEGGCSTTRRAGSRPGLALAALVAAFAIRRSRGRRSGS